MATSETQICNLALAHLGEAPIVSLAEDTAGGRACALLYETTRDAILRSHRWNFARDRQTLSELATAPAFGWERQYQLPSDCLRVLEFNDTEAGDVLTDPFELESGKLLTDADEARIVYIRREENVGKYDPLFVKMLAAELAMELSEAIRGTTGKTAEIVAYLERKIAPLARRVDANEGRRRKGLLPLNSHAIRARMSGAFIPETTTE